MRNDRKGSDVLTSDVKTRFCSVMCLIYVFRYEIQKCIQYVNKSRKIQYNALLYESACNNDDITFMFIYSNRRQHEDVAWRWPLPGQAVRTVYTRLHRPTLHPENRLLLLSALTQDGAVLQIPPRLELLSMYRGARHCLITVSRLCFE